MMLRNRFPYILAVSMLATVAFAATFLLASATSAEVYTQSDTPTPYPFWPPQREERNGYLMIEEDTLLRMGRVYAGLDPYASAYQTDGLKIEIEEETTFYIKAGYWSWTGSFPNFRNTPDHPLFVYTVKGKLGRAYAGYGGLSIDPNAPTAIPEPLTSSTIVIDPVAGNLVTFFPNRYLTDFSGEAFSEENRQANLAFAAIYEAEIGMEETLIATSDSQSVGILHVTSANETAMPIP